MRGESDGTTKAPLPVARGRGPVRLPGGSSVTLEPADPRDSPPPKLSIQAVGKRLTKETGMVFGGTVLLKGVTIISSIILARLLGASALGTWAVVTATGGMAWVLAELGLGAATVRIVAQAKEDERERVKAETTALYLALLVGAGVIGSFAALTPLLAAELYRLPETLPLFLLLCVSMFFTLGPNIFTSVLQAHRRIGVMAVTSLGLGILHAVGLVIGAWTLGLPGAFLSALVLAVLSWGVYWWQLRDGRSWSRRDFDRGMARRFLALGLPTVVSTLLISLGAWLALTFLTLKVLASGPGVLDVVGEYSVAWRVAAFLAFPASALFVVLFPFASEVFHRDQELFAGTFRHTTRYTLLGAVPLSFVFVLLAPEIVGLLYGQGFSEAGPLLSLLVAGGFLAALTPWGSMLFYVSDSMLDATKVYSLAVMLQIGVAAALIPPLGALGLVVATLTYQFAVISLAPLFLRGKQGQADLARAYAWASGAAVGLLAVGLLSQGWPLLLRIVALAALLGSYAAILHGLVMTPGDRRFLRSLLRGLARRIGLGQRP